MKKRSRILSCIISMVLMTSCLDTSETSSTKNTSTDNNDTPVYYDFDMIANSQGHPALFGKTEDLLSFDGYRFEGDAVVVMQSSNYDRTYEKAFLIFDCYESDGSDIIDSSMINAIHFNILNCKDIPRPHVDDTVNVLSTYMPVDVLQERYEYRGSFYKNIWSSKENTDDSRKRKYLYDYYTMYELVKPDEPDISYSEPETTTTTTTTTTMITTTEPAQTVLSDGESELFGRLTETDDSESNIVRILEDNEFPIDEEYNDDLLSESEMISEQTTLSVESIVTEEQVTELENTETTTEETTVAEEEPQQEFINYPQWITLHIYTDGWNIAVAADIVPEKPTYKKEGKEWGIDYTKDIEPKIESMNIGDCYYDQELSIEYPRPTKKMKLKSGEESDYVGWLQCALNKVMNTNLDVNCIFDDDTKEALKEFQSLNEMKANGEADKKVVDLLVDIILGNKELPETTTTTEQEEIILKETTTTMKQTTVQRTAPVTIPDGEYILNTKSGKFHRTNCSEVAKMKDENKEKWTNCTADDLINQGYTPCGKCHPK